MSFCVYRTISLTAESIWFSITMYLLIGPGKVITILSNTTLPRDIAPWKKDLPQNNLKLTL